MELESGIAAFETKNFAHATKLLSPIAEEGNSDAMYRMAIMLQNGLGCLANEEKAFEVKLFISQYIFLQSAQFWFVLHLHQRNTIREKKKIRLHQEDVNWLVRILSKDAVCSRLSDDASIVSA